MLVKYLSRLPRVNRIVHFDAPMDSGTLFSLDFREVVAASGPAPVVADVIDDQRTFKGPGSPWRNAKEKNYEQVLGLSDVTLENCEPVRQSMIEYADDVHLVPSALEMPDAVAVRGLGAFLDLPRLTRRGGAIT